MPAPANTNELLDLIQRSGVADEAKLRAYVQKLTQSSGMPSDPAKLAGTLVRDGVLTYFQAEQLLQGKYKRFTIGKYKVLEKLGAGGMAQVFLCEHKLMRRRVAIKVLPTAKADDPSSLQRFYREAKAIAAVDHPNIVRAYDIDQDENLHFLVMEYVDGINLHDLVKKFGAVDITRACHYIYGASVGLDHAHEMGLVHRDIKPGNILVDRAGVVKILDMGLARFFHDEDDVLTKKYDENVLGTADYLAPEQALESHTVDIRADIYSLGATFYYLLTGSALFPEGSVAQKLIWHQNRLPKAIRSIRPEVPAEVAAIVEKMMAKDREQRYQTPSEVMAALAPFVTTPIPPPADRELPQISLAAGGGVGGRGTTLTAQQANAGAAATLIRNSGTSTHTMTAPGTTAGLPTGYAPPTPVSITPAPLPLPGPSGDPAVWESLDSEGETQSVSQSDTDRTTPRIPSPRRSPAAPNAGGSRTLLYVGLAGLVLAGAGAGIYFGFFSKGTKPDPIVPLARTGRITVSKAGGENTVSTLREALARAIAGDTIVIAEPKLTEPHLSLKGAKYKDIAIEGVTADGKPPVIEPSGSGRPAMLDLTDVDGLRLRNLEFDCKGQTDVGIVIAGGCPGLVVENVTVRGAKVAGFKTSNAAGEAGRPIVLDRVRVLVGGPNQSGLWQFAVNTETQRLAVRNSRFEGTGAGWGVRFEGATSDVEIVGNRFFNLDAAISFTQPPTTKTVKAQITSNTIYQSKNALLFDLPPPVPNEPPMGAFALSVTQNFFGKTSALAAVNGPAAPAGVSSSDNAHTESNGNNVPINSTALPTPPALPVNPDDDAKFLRFPNGPLDVAGKRVGAP
jgi:eukaryotic-like serine/threonine-protein kinase